MRKKIGKSQQGIAAIIMVALISLVAILMAVGFARAGLNNLEISDNDLKGGEALNIAEGCAEDALEILYINNSYTVEDLAQNLGGGTCQVSVRDEGSEKIIVSSAVYLDSHKKIIVRLAINNPTININSWNEEE